MPSRFVPFSTDGPIACHLCNTKERDTESSLLTNNVWLVQTKYSNEMKISYPISTDEMKLQSFKDA